MSDPLYIIPGVGFLFDAETAHHERSISVDGRNMRSDIETLRRVAGLRLRQYRGIARGRLILIYLLLEFVFSMYIEYLNSMAV